MIQGVALLGEYPGKAAPRIFEIAVVERDGEGHVRRLGRRLQMGEERGEVRIGRLVIDDEAGVDRDAAAVALRLDGMRMTARPPFGLEPRP